MYINNPGHMTKMAAMAIYDKNRSKIYGTGGPISQVLQCIIIYNPVITVTYFPARST